MVNSPIVWFGGKGNFKKKIVPVLEQIEHKYYVEPFGGGASILLAKQPKSVETYNDIDSGLYDLFRVLADHSLFLQFERQVALLPWSRQFYNDYVRMWRDEKDLIMRVAMWFLIARQSFSGNFEGSWSSSVTTSCHNKASTASKWLSNIDNLPAIHARLQRVQIENDDWRNILFRYDTNDTLFYCDPPYVPETRSGGTYNHEMTINDHIELVNVLLNVKGMVVLSGYAHKIYNPLTEAGWHTIIWNTASYAAGRTRNSNLIGKGSAMLNQARTEVLWISPSCKRMQQMSMF